MYSVQFTSGPSTPHLDRKIDTEEIVGRHWHRLAGKRGKGLVGLSQKSTNKRACANNPEYSKCTQYSFNHVPCFVTYLFVFQYIPFLVKLREWRTGRKCLVRTPEKCAWGQTRKLYIFEWYNFLIMYLIILIHLTNNAGQRLTSPGLSSQVGKFGWCGESPNRWVSRQRPEYFP